MELKASIRGIEKSFTIVEVPEDKKVNIEAFYITEEVDFSWNTVKDRLLGPDFTWNRFLEELKMSGSMTSKFAELSRFILEFMSSERLKMRIFEEGLAFYIHNQLASQLIRTCQELYERAAEVK